MQQALSETWATAYLQILIVFFVFALSIHGLEFWLNVPDEIRRVTYRRMGVSGWALPAALFYIAYALFAWALQPWGVGGRRLSAPAANYIVTLLPLAAIGFWAYQLHKYRRETVIRGIKRDLLKGFRQSGSLESALLDDLTLLGSYGKSGHEKGLVLDALRETAGEVQSSEKYGGGELEELIRSLGVVLENKERPGEDADYLAAIPILREIRQNFSANKRVSIYLDAELTASTIKRLAVNAVRHRSDEVARALLQLASESNSDIVFNIGTAALDAKKFELATAALNLLESLAEEQKQLAHSDETANFLGLLAQFDACGRTTRKRARLYLAKVEHAFVPSLEACLNRAAQYHFIGNNYDTCDRIEDLLAGLCETG
jgi:hypothetical protein